jgi:hypothetical protein
VQQQALLLTHIYVVVDNMRNSNVHGPNGAKYQSPGLAALFAAYPGKDAAMRSTLKGLSTYATPFRVDREMLPVPRVGGKKGRQPWALFRCPFGAVFCLPASIINMGKEQSKLPHSKLAVYKRTVSYARRNGRAFSSRAAIGGGLL